MSTSLGTPAKSPCSPGGDDVVEIGLLLPASWAKALVEMSKRRRESVGQILRDLIDRELSDDLLSRS